MIVDIRKVKKLIELMEASADITEIEIKEAEEAVRISRQQPTAGVQTISMAPQAAPAIPTQPAPAPAVASETAEPEASALPKGHAVTAPMVGTLYLAPSPGAKNFVEVGQTVKAGETICIIEAMKMFNEIEADRAGVIAAIVAENGQPVEFGQTLVIIE